MPQLPILFKKKLWSKTSNARDVYEIIFRKSKCVFTSSVNADCILLVIQTNFWILHRAFGKNFVFDQR